MLGNRNKNLLSLPSILGGGGGSGLLSGFYFWKGVGGGFSFLFSSTPSGEAQQDQNGLADQDQGDGYEDAGVLIIIIKLQNFSQLVGAKSQKHLETFVGGWGPLA